MASVCLDRSRCRADHLRADRKPLPRAARRGREAIGVHGRRCRVPGGITRVRGAMRRAAADAPNWSPTQDCDIGSSPAPAIVGSDGRARFEAGDPNHTFQPFVGLGPEGLFSCLAPDVKSPKNGLPEYRNCQVRVSSNNTRRPRTRCLFPSSSEARRRAPPPRDRLRPHGSSSRSSSAVIAARRRRVRGLSRAAAGRPLDRADTASSERSAEAR